MRNFVLPVLAIVLACSGGPDARAVDQAVKTDAALDPAGPDPAAWEDVGSPEAIVPGETGGEHAEIRIAEEAAGDDGADETPGATDTMDRSDADGSGLDACPEGFIFIDFPCDKEVVCTGAYTYQNYKTAGCLDLGYDPHCCSGATCLQGAIEDCPEGTLCVRSGAQWLDDACAPADCGGPGGPLCPEGQFCERPEDTCDTNLAGVCLDASGCFDPCAGSLSLSCPWVCGCDGQSYPSDCDRRLAGVSRAHEGTCCAPGKVEFDQANAQGFTGFAACLDSAIEWPDLVFPGAKCAEVGLSPLCDDDERACTGPLILDPGGTSITDDSWQMACRVAGYPFVSRVVGFSCTGVAPDPVPLCEAGCASPCGCEKCPQWGGAKCDGNTLLTCHPGATCWDARPCPGKCLPESPSGAMCARTCEEIEADWNETVAGNAECGTDGPGCHVLRGHCEVGLGGCWVVASDSFPQKELDWLADEWTLTGCTSSECNCAGPPTAACVGGKCVPLISL